jgi:hypothetical protein
VNLNVAAKTLRAYPILPSSPVSALIPVLLKALTNTARERACIADGFASLFFLDCIRAQHTQCSELPSFRIFFNCEVSHLHFVALCKGSILSHVH